MIFGNTLEISQANVFLKTHVSLPVESHKTSQKHFSLPFIPYNLVVQNRLQTCIVHLTYQG